VASASGASPSSPQQEANMANVQKQFDEFNDTIKLGRFDENQTLREKRDIIRDKLRERLPAVFKKYKESCPAYSFRDQGSYEMGAGTKPLDGDFDIDQGLYFMVPSSSYPDPVTLKKRVHEALDGHTKDVRIRRPCVTVFYQRSGESVYHVDLAIYSDGKANTDAKGRIAMGREGSTAAYRVWDVSNPQALTDTIFARFTGIDRDQFRRVVRALKRWKHENFPADGHAAPLGIALTVATYHDLQPTYTDRVAGTADDLGALRTLVTAILARFRPVWSDDEQKVTRRLTVALPVEPWSDLCGRMTAKQMEQLEGKLQILRDALDNAAKEVDPVEACKTLRKVFGADFPIPDKGDTAKKHAPAIVSSSNSA